MLDATLADWSKYDSELHHLIVQMRQLPLPFLREKQQLPACQVQNAEADPPRKLESWNALHFSSLKRLKSLGTLIPYYYELHPLWTWANEPAYTNTGDLRFNKFKNWRSWCKKKKKNQLDSPKTEKEEEFLCCGAHFLRRSFPNSFFSNLPTCMHEHLSPPLDAPFLVTYSFESDFETCFQLNNPSFKNSPSDFP